MTKMRFRNFGGIHQFVVATAEDLSRIDDLDPARWAATSAPLDDLHCDAKFLAHIDPDGTKRVRHQQLIAARDWLFERLAKREVVGNKSDVIPIDAIDGKGDAGKALRAAAERVNREQKTADATKIALADVRAFKGRYHELLANGDGVVPAGIVPEDDVKAFIEVIVGAKGGVPDRGGAKGVDAATLDAFLEATKACVTWREAEAASLVWGADTAAAMDLVDALDRKLEELFLHCDLQRQETPNPESLHLKDDDLRALRAKSAADIESYLAGSPIATPNPRGELMLTEPINAVYRDTFEALHEKVIKRALGTSPRVLTRADWRKVKETLAPFAKWRGEKPKLAFDDLSLETLRGYLDGKLEARVRHFIDLDKGAAAELDAVDDLEKLLLYVRWLVTLVNNFVNFSAIYDPRELALMEAGSLVIDGRRLDFCMKVFDRAVHKPVATESLIFLVYAKIQTKDAGPVAYEVVAPLTGGERGKLRLGKRGIFIDTDGKEYDAIITELVENPISVKEAAVAPFRRASRFISEKIEQWVGSKQAAQESAMIARTQEGVTAAQQTADTSVDVALGAAEPPPPSGAAPAAAGATPPRRGLDMNTLVLGGGMALAGLGAMLAGLISALTSLNGWLAILGVVLLVMGVSALSGWLKLRKRDMSLLLEASGWAVNVHMKITARIARVFAFTPALPKDSYIDRRDLLPPVPGERRAKVKKFFTTLFVIAGLVGLGYVYYRWLWDRSETSGTGMGASGQAPDVGGAPAQPARR